MDRRLALAMDEREASQRRIAALLFVHKGSSRSAARAAPGRLAGWRPRQATRHRDWSISQLICDRPPRLSGARTRRCAKTSVLSSTLHSPQLARRVLAVIRRHWATTSGRRPSALALEHVEHCLLAERLNPSANDIKRLPVAGRAFGSSLREEKSTVNSGGIEKIHTQTGEVFAVKPLKYETAPRLVAVDWSVMDTTVAGRSRPLVCEFAYVTK
jgi:hypothetical protein